MAKPLDHPEFGMVPGPGDWIGGIDDKVRDALQGVLRREARQTGFDFPVICDPRWQDPDEMEPGAVGSVTIERWKIVVIRRRDNWRGVTESWKVAFGPHGQQLAGESWEED